MIWPLLEAAAADERRYKNVETLGVDEHIWHHLNPARRAPKALTGMVDLSRDEEGTVVVRLLDLVPGRTGAVCANWLEELFLAF